MTVKKRIEISVLLALLFTALLSAVKFEANCCDIKSNILRLHIIANSDSDSDQQLKLKVRDAVLKVSDNIFDGAKCKEDAIKSAIENKQKLLDTAKKVIKDNKKNYSVRADVENRYFPTKEYENFTLPAGYYDALSIKIGSAKGHNWWCVLFPEVCLSASADITDNLNKSTAQIVEKPKDYKLEFKAVEIYNEVKNKLFSFFS